MLLWIEIVQYVMGRQKLKFDCWKVETKKDKLESLGCFFFFMHHINQSANLPVSQSVSQPVSQSASQPVSQSIIISFMHSSSLSFIHFALSILKIFGLPYRRRQMIMAKYYPSKFELLHAEPNGQWWHEMSWTSIYNQTVIRPSRMLRPTVL